VGLENMKIQAPSSADIYSAVNMENIIDSWVCNVIGQETQSSFNVSKTAKRITLDMVINNNSTAQHNSAPKADFSVTGTQILINRCQSNGTGSWPIVTSSTGTGPIVVLSFSSSQKLGFSPHQRWTTGILADNCTFPNAPVSGQGIAYRNRVSGGSGQGWACGWAVAWNVTTPYFLVSEAPGTLSWAIGGSGRKTSRASYGDADGIYDNFNKKVAPLSLYRQQLGDRLGSSALNYECPVATVLSVSLISFNAKATFGKCIIEWATTSENNNDYFKVESSGNGLDFDELITTKGKNANAGINNYQAIDSCSLIGDNFYRLTQFDRECKKTIFGTKLVNFTAAEPMLLKVFENPVHNTLIVSHPISTSGSFLKIISINGQEMSTNTVVPNVGQTTLNVTNIKAEPHVLTYYNDNHLLAAKFLKMK